jgi:hypothetical protein
VCLGAKVRRYGVVDMVDGKAEGREEEVGDQRGVEPGVHDQPAQTTARNSVQAKGTQGHQRNPKVRQSADGHRRRPYRGDRQQASLVQGS